MRHLLRRIGFYLIALWVSISITFIIPRMAPGDPAQLMLAKLQSKATPNTLKALEIEFGISHQSLWQQYFQYIGNLAHGDLGISLTYFPSPVTSIIAQDLPWTLGLIGLATVISFSLGTVLGIIAAWRRGTRFDSIVTPMLTFFAAIPYFWLALILLYMLGFVLNWFPINGGYDIYNIDVGLTPDFIVSVIQHGFLPALTIVISSISGWMLGMRNAMLTTLAEDYVVMATAKGLSEWRVMFVYAARNAILPNITGFAMSLGFIVGGALLTEIVFSYPGIGFALYQAVQGLDYSLIQGIFLMIAVTVLVANFLADLVNVLLDPRVRDTRG